MKDSDYKECIENAEFVKMTKTEFGILLERFGKDRTLKAVEKLDNWKGSKGKRYKSDYRAILSWVIDAVTSNGSTQFPDYYSQKFEKTLTGNMIPQYHRHLESIGWKKFYSGTAGTTWTRL